jgi:hypothetical protein
VGRWGESLCTRAVPVMEPRGDVRDCAAAPVLVVVVVVVVVVAVADMHSQVYLEAGSFINAFDAYRRSRSLKCAVCKLPGRPSPPTTGYPPLPAAFSSLRRSQRRLLHKVLPPQLSHWMRD